MVNAILDAIMTRVTTLLALCSWKTKKKQLNLIMTFKKKVAFNSWFYRSVGSEGKIKYTAHDMTNKIVLTLQV